MERAVQILGPVLGVEIKKEAVACLTLINIFMKDCI
jgi:hypothetical protein